MNLRKTILLTGILVAITTAATAVTYNPGVDEPIEKQYNDTIDNVEVNTEYFNTSVNSNQLRITGEQVIPSESYTVNVDLAGNSTDQFTIDVPSYNNFQVTPVNISDTISIGSSGQLEKVNLTGNGNSIAEADLKLTGNITEFVTLLDRDKFVPTSNTRPVNLVYDVPRNQAFGDYTGNLSIKTSQKTENVSINLELLDEIKPVIEDGNVPSLMATNSESFSWTVSDNLDVSSGSVEVFREEERVVNVSTGETDVVNVSVDEANLSRMDGNDAVWTYSFDDSGEIGSYFVNASFTDSAGNTVTEGFDFDVEGLDSVSVLNSDFRFEDSRPRNSDNPSRVVEKSVFEKTDSKPVNVSVQKDFTVSGNNSVNIGIRREGSANPSTLYTNESFSNVTVTEPGKYYLSVYSNDAGFSYSGTLQLETVPQHVEIDDTIEFSGSFVDPQYPEIPENYSIGSFTGTMKFVTNENGVPTGLEAHLRKSDITDCKGVDSLSDCIPGWTWDELAEEKEENDRMKDKVVIWKSVGGFALFWMFFVFLNNVAKGTRITMKKVPESKIGDVVDNVSQVEV